MADIAGRFGALPRGLRVVCLVVLGLIAALGQAPLGFWWATVAALGLLLFLFQAATTPRRALAHGWLFGVGYFGWALRWIVEPFLVDAASTGWMAPFALLFMAVGAGLFWGLAAWLARRLGGGSDTFALLLVLAEATRSLILTGFPWALLGHIWVDTPLAQLAAVIGPHGLTGVTLLLALSLCGLACGRRIDAAALVAAVLLAVILAPGPAPTSDGPLIRLVQPNVPQSEKWDPDKRDANFARLITPTAQLPRPDLIVWPETAIPVLMNYAHDTLQSAAEAAAGVPLITGINRADGPRYHNALVLLGPEGQPRAIYDKAHLAPFGEYIPGGEWLARFGITGLAASTGGGFTPGGIQPLIDLPGIGPARALICYEGIFAEEVGHQMRPRLMVLITNDAWFGTAAGPYQHLAQARLRAIEQGLPMVRVANTGISAMIDAKGRITGSIPLGVAGHVDAPLPAAGSLPPYARTGDLPVLGVILLLLAVTTARRRREKH